MTAPIVEAAGDPVPPAAVARAVDALAAGAVVGLPTDTVYGLAADPTSAAATAAVFRVKERPEGLELPVLVADVAQAESLAGPLPAPARALVERWWPGPLTLVLPRHPGATLHLGGDPTTVGLRCPAHPVPLALCRAWGPIATTSANRHGAPPASTAGEVAELAGVALVLDAGACPQAPSTVVSLLGPDPRLLREGGVAWADIAEALGA